MSTDDKLILGKWSNAPSCQITNYGHTGSWGAWDWYIDDELAQRGGNSFTPSRAGMVSIRPAAGASEQPEAMRRDEQETQSR